MFGCFPGTKNLLEQGNFNDIFPYKKVADFSYVCIQDLAHESDVSCFSVSSVVK